ncbi:hypothetical protein [Actinomadura rupiterrae]|uniref:hypothetical protein n=1 Tax=Actinomadura rupiterrae TaxID=559627 RepID=UPI0020A4585C|nr:hypothetical protein [Actinomadura rupiterrae]MCP2343085.1 hypothetical protein [Actinomadura rupiterrae]
MTTLLAVLTALSAVLAAAAELVRTCVPLLAAIRDLCETITARPGQPATELRAEAPKQANKGPNTPGPHP